MPRARKTFSERSNRCWLLTLALAWLHLHLCIYIYICMFAQPYTFSCVCTWITFVSILSFTYDYTYVITCAYANTNRLNVSYTSSSLKFIWVLKDERRTLTLRVFVHLRIGWIYEYGNSVREWSSFPARSGVATFHGSSSLSSRQFAAAVQSKKGC